jgi:hypothetical protein
LPFLDAECVDKKLDILYVVDGSGSIREPNFKNITRELKEMNGKFAIGPDKIQIAAMQFGRTTDTRIEFKLGEKNTLQTVNEGVDNMKWLSSLRTATGDALKKAREQVRLVYILFKLMTFIYFLVEEAVTDTRTEGKPRPIMFQGLRMIVN